MSKILLCPVTNYQSVSKTHVNDFSKVQLCRNSWDTLSVGRELLRESREELHRWLQRINSGNEGRRGDTGEMGEERTGEERESDRWSERGRRDQGNLHGKKKKKRRACAALHRSTATGAFRFEHACSKHSAYLLNISGLQQFITIYYRHTSPVTHANARLCERSNRKIKDRTTSEQHVTPIASELKYDLSCVHRFHERFIFNLLVTGGSALQQQSNMHLLSPCIHNYIKETQTL